MAEKYRVGVLGMSHDHVWGNLQCLIESDEGELVAAADPHEELREQVKKMGCEKVYSDYYELLDNEKLDAVYIFSDNRESAILAQEALGRGLHVMVEKPMAATAQLASRMRGAAKAAGKVLMINWPTMWSYGFQKAIQMIEEGQIGKVFQVVYRSAHAGPRELGCSPYFSEWLYDPERNGAGALMDYCCYGAAMTCLVLGLPSRVTGVSARLSKQDLYAEDNAMLIMQHAEALSQTTASWTQSGHLTSYIPMFYGSEGTLVVEHDKLLLANAEHENGIEIEVPELPKHLRDSASFFFHHIRTGEPIKGICSPDVSFQAQQVLEAGLISAREGRTIQLPLSVDYL